MSQLSHRRASQGSHEFFMDGEIVGTGVWTRRLVRHADGVTAVDASPEAIELACARVDDRRVSYVCADLFA